MTFVNSPWIDTAANLVLIGDTGLGKSHIGSALCYEAIVQGYTAVFITAFDFTSKIQKSLSPTAKIDYYSRIKVLCIDELGYTYHKKEDTDILFRSSPRDRKCCPLLYPRTCRRRTGVPSLPALLHRPSSIGSALTAGSLLSKGGLIDYLENRNSNRF